MMTTASPDATVASSDDVLVQRARVGDTSAFDTLVGRYQKKVYGLALRITGDSREAEDALQEAFLQAYRHVGSFRGDARFSTWLYRIATNAALMQRRASRRHQAESMEEYLPRFNEEGRLERLDLDYGRAAQADEILERKQLAKRALEGVSGLPEEYRAVFVLRDLEELSTEETAEILGIRSAAVRQRLHRARLMLRGYLGALTRGEQ